MKPGASTRPCASITRSPGAGESFPTDTMRLPRIRSAPLIIGAPKPSASCALMMSSVSGAGAARKTRGIATVKTTATERMEMMRRELCMRTVPRKFWHCGPAAGVVLPPLARLQAHYTELIVLIASAEMVPDSDKDDGDDEDERRDRVDFGSDAAAEAAPNFQRQRALTADKKESDGDFVHGERKDQQACGD